MFLFHVSHLVLFIRICPGLYLLNYLDLISLITICTFSTSHPFLHPHTHTNTTITTQHPHNDSSSLLTLHKHKSIASIPPLSGTCACQFAHECFCMCACPVTVCPSSIHIPQKQPHPPKPRKPSMCHLSLNASVFMGGVSRFLIAVVNWSRNRRRRHRRCRRLSNWATRR